MAHTFNYVEPSNPGPYCSGDIRFNVNTNMSEIYDGVTWNVVAPVVSNTTTYNGFSQSWHGNEHESCLNAAKHFSSMMDSNGIHRLTDNPTIADAYANALDAVEQLAVILSLTKKQKNSS